MSDKEPLSICSFVKTVEPTLISVLSADISFKNNSAFGFEILLLNKLY